MPGDDARRRAAEADAASTRPEAVAVSVSGKLETTAICAETNVAPSPEAEAASPKRTLAENPFST